MTETSKNDVTDFLIAVTEACLSIEPQYDCYNINVVALSCFVKCKFIKGLKKGAQPTKVYWYDTVKKLDHNKNRIRQTDDDCISCSLAYRKLVAHYPKLREYTASILAMLVISGFVHGEPKSGNIPTLICYNDLLHFLLYNNIITI